MKLGIVLTAWATCLLSGCAFEPGDPFGRIHPSVEVGYSVPAGRQRPDGYAQLSSDYQVAVDAFRITAGVPHLLAAAPDAEIAAFDPTSPPPGYDTCHNGHCHRADGALVDYEDIAAELSGGSAALQRIPLTGPDGLGELDALGGVSRMLECPGGCNVGRLRLQRVELPLRAVEITGRIRDSRSPPRFEGELPFRWTRIIVPGSTESEGPRSGTAEIDARIERGEPVDLSLPLSLPLGPELFDVGSFSELAPHAVGELVIDAENNPEVGTVLTERLLSALRAEIVR